MEKYQGIVTFLVASLGVMAVIMPFIIEFIKNMITEEKVISIFGNLERFSALVSAIFAIIAYVSLNILMPEIFALANIWQKVVIGFFYTGACAIASQVGYDKIIKWIINRK